MLFVIFHFFLSIFILILKIDLFHSSAVLPKIRDSIWFLWGLFFNCKWVIVVSVVIFAVFLSITSSVLKGLMLFTLFVRLFREPEFHSAVYLLWTITNPKRNIVVVDILFVSKAIQWSSWFLWTLRDTSIFFAGGQSISCSLQILPIFDSFKDKSSTIISKTIHFWVFMNY